MLYIFFNVAQKSGSYLGIFFYTFIHFFRSHQSYCTLKGFLYRCLLCIEFLYYFIIFFIKTPLFLSVFTSLALLLSIAFTLFTPSINSYEEWSVPSSPPNGIKSSNRLNYCKRLPFMSRILENAQHLKSSIHIKMKRNNDPPHPESIQFSISNNTNDFRHRELHQLQVNQLRREGLWLAKSSQSHSYSKCFRPMATLLLNYAESPSTCIAAVMPFLRSAGEIPRGSDWSALGSCLSR